MKILFKIKGKVETIANVSVDYKCLPLVGGIHPFSASSKSKSPLALESSLWFKTLAVDCVYVDCDSSCIFWTAVRNENIGEDVKLRRKVSAVSYHSDFVPDHARPLVSDLSLFDFDASYKEMLVKSREVAKKLISKSISVHDSNSMVANLLHVYILPAIKFNASDMYSLSRARCLIEERHSHADVDISTKAQALNLLQLSLDNLKENLLYKDNFESETYLQTCNRKFLKVFLRKIEQDSIKMNLDLEAQQSKVNWSKQHKYEKEKILELQKKRDNLFKEVEKLIKVREALKNVVTRKARKKKQGRQQIIDSCFHNVFLEILRRLELENKTMEQLVEDKLNISAAREAIMSVILDFDNANRIGSDRSTRFEPFGDYHLDSSVQVEKSDAWLTLQERVSKLLRDRSSDVFSVHMAGCRNIKLQIDLALSEFNLHARKQAVDAQSRNDIESNSQIQEDRESNSQIQEDSYLDTITEILPKIEVSHDQENQSNVPADQSSTDETTEHESILATEWKKPANEISLPSSSSDRRSGVFFPKDTTPFISSVDDKVQQDDQQDNVEDTAVQKKDIHHDTAAVQKKDIAKNKERECLGFVVLENSHPHDTPKPPVSQPHDITEPPAGQQTQNHFISENLAINMLMIAVDNIKAVIHDHFREVVKCLQLHLNDESDDPFEILWKAYERHFSEEILLLLTTLYEAMLEHGSKDVYEEIRKTSLQEIMDGDKILNLFFRPSSCRVSDLTLDERGQTLDAISMALTFSNASLDVRQYSVNELYKLANADSNDLCRRFQLDTSDDLLANQVIVGSTSSSESGASVKTGDLFDDDDDEGISHSSNSSFHSAKAEGYQATNSNSTNDGTATLDSNQSLTLTDEGMSKDAPPPPPLTDIDSKFYSSDIGCSDAHTHPSLFLSPHEIIDLMDPVLSPFRKQVSKCMKAKSVLDKMRYLSKAVQGLNTDITHLYGGDHVSACDDIISMLVLSLANMPEDIFVGLYSNLRLLIDILPSFLSGTLCDFNLVSLFASYDYLLNRNVCQRVVKRYGASFKVKFSP